MDANAMDAEGPDKERRYDGRAKGYERLSVQQDSYPTSSYTYSLKMRFARPLRFVHFFESERYPAFKCLSTARSLLKSIAPIRRQ